MELERSIDKDRMCILKGITKEQVLLELIELIGRSAEIQDVEELKRSIFYREKLMSTGIGLGIAVPHVRIEGVRNPITAIGISHSGIPDYESIDDQIVKIVVLIVAGKDQHKRYIRLLSEIVSKMKSDDVIENLLKAENSEEIYNIFSGKNDA